MYPELRALIGPNVPDLRGLFLRGTGGNAGPLGVAQIDTMRPITGNTSLSGASTGLLPGPAIGLPIIGGAFRVGDTLRPWGTQGSGAPASDLILNSALLGPNFSGTETRPVNQAVRYLIRAAL